MSCSVLNDQTIVEYKAEFREFNNKEILLVGDKEEDEYIIPFCLSITLKKT